MVGNQETSTKTNLINIMKNFISRSYNLYQTPLSQIARNNSDLYYLYRNGLSESFFAVNSSIDMFINQQELITENILMIVLLLALSAIVLMIFCFFFVIIPTLFSAEKSNGTVWKLFYLLPLDLIQEMRARSEERLEITHGVEIERVDEPQKFKNLASRKFISMKKKWPMILVRISFYYILSTGLFVFFYYFAYKNFGNVLKTKPNLVNISGLRTYSTNSAYFWLQELKYANSSLSFLYDSSSNRYLASAELEINKALTLLMSAEHSLLFGSYSGTGMDSTHENFLLQEGCFASNCLLLAKGLHAGILSYIEDVKDLQFRIENGELPDLTNILQEKDELAYGEKVLFDMYDQFMTNTINTYISTVIWVTAIYCVITTFMYFLIYIPIINSVKEEVTKVWKLGRLIPIEHRNKIMAAFKEAIGKK